MFMGIWVVFSAMIGMVYSSHFLPIGAEFHVLLIFWISSLTLACFCSQLGVGGSVGFGIWNEISMWVLS